MTREEFIRAAEDYVAQTDDNRIQASYAIQKSDIGMSMYDAPIIRFCSVDDPGFAQLRQKEAVGPHFLLPREWLPEAETVISMFLPLSEAVRSSNRADMEEPSAAWMHARIEGNAMLGNLTKYLRRLLEQDGEVALIPFFDSRMQVNEDRVSNIPKFSSNWSERHVAYVCGLGTFGLSKGLITEHGVAGRFASILTSGHFPHDQRSYTGLYDYCVMCGTCARNCPADAISLENGKDHQKCSDFLVQTKIRYQPRYGCGKCQVLVPCEHHAAKRA